MSLRGRAFMFTCQHGFEEVFEYLKSLDYSYLLIGGFEQGETQQGEDIKHNHSYIDFGKTIRLAKIQKYLKNFGHITVMHHHDSDYAAICSSNTSNKA